MSQTRLTYKINWKANMGDYEMLDTTIGIECDVEPGETPSERLAKAKRLVQRELEAAVKEARDIVKGA